MSTQAQYNANYASYILYYVFQSGNVTKYDRFLANVCSPVYDGSGNIQITVWQLGTTPAAPSNATLLAYTLATVTTFYSNMYLNPSAALSAQPFLALTTTQINAMIVDATYTGYSVYDTTSQGVRVYNGTSWVLNAFLPLAGGTMTGAIAMGTNNITNIGTLSGATLSTLADNIVSISTAQATGNLPAFSASSKVLVDSTVVAANVVTATTGGTVGNLLSFSAAKVATDSTWVAANVVSTASIGTAGRVVTFSAAKAVQDSGIFLSALATTASLSAYLLLAGGTMTGAIAMGANNITNLGTLSGATNSRTADNIVSISTTQATGNLPAFSASSKVLVDSTVVAANVVSNTGTSVTNRVAVFSDVTGKFIIDGGSTLAQYLLLAGGTMSGAIAMGGNAITNVSAVIGSRVDANAAGALIVGDTNATAVTIGRAGVLTSIAGIAALSQSYGAWYASTNTSPNFTANVNRTIDLVNTAGALVDFTVSAVTGALTYTGARTRRAIIQITIILTLPSMQSSPVTHFIAINPATPPVLSTTQEVSIVDVTAATQGSRVRIALFDLIQVSTGDVIRLCGSQNNTNNSGVYNYAACKVIGLLN